VHNNPESPRPRPYIGITFKCCNVYTRIYINRAQTAYVGYCPKCTAKVEIKIAPNGCPSRFWFAE